MGLFALSFNGCKSDAVAPDASIEALVGDWNGDVFIITSLANPDQSADLIAAGATFTLNVQASGQYTAILIFNDQPQTEIGQLSVSGTNITLRRTYPAPPDTTTGTYSLDGNRLTVDGETDYDFDLNGTKEPARLHFELVKQ